MSSLLTRMFASFTLVLLLAVGWLGVRVFVPEMKTVEINASVINVFSNTTLKASQPELLNAPVLSFQEIKFSTPKAHIAKKIKLVKEAIVVKTEKIEVNFKYQNLSKHELPFQEPILLSPVFKAEDLVADNSALFKEFKFEAIAQNDVIEDRVETKLAATVEPEFFEYPQEEKKIISENKKPVNESGSIDSLKEEVQTVAQASEPTEEVQVEDLFAFDYSKAEHDLKEKNLPTVSMVSSHKNDVSGTEILAKDFYTKNKNENKDKKEAVSSQNDKLVSDFIKPPLFENSVSIQITGTDFVTSKGEVGFEVRPQDDLSESFFDYNNGEVKIDGTLSSKKMTRSVAILKRGYAPTNLELILEEGASEITAPLIEEEAFNSMIAPFEERGPLGVVLVELDEKTEEVSLDVPYSKVIRLDEKMKKVEGSSFSYQLFVGVKAGNALLSFKSSTGEKTSKIIHIHERETTFDTNFYEESSNEKVALFEEDLLSKEKMPLIISGEKVKIFATEQTAKKVNDHTYTLPFNKVALGGRKYLELTHLDEPIFVGFRDASSISVPSENFIRNIISRTDKAGMGNRCLVQVNLSRKASRVDIGTESLGESLRTYTQMLDVDGKFYDTLGAKSEKIIIVGENQESGSSIADSKINIKITYEDNSVQYLGSYCSPNTYLVEQL